VTHNPTPSNVPTQIWVRFPDAPDADGLIAATIGCDGEERASPEVRTMMSLLVFAIGETVRMLPDGTPDGRLSAAAAESAWRIGQAIIDGAQDGEGGAE